MLTETKVVALLTTLVATVGACGGGVAPDIAPIADQIAQVGVELTIPIVATDPDGDSLSYEFATAIPNIGERASITKTPSEVGVFRWTPLSADVGVWPIDFIIDDGSHTETVTIQIDVRSAVGEQSAPIFRKPLGTGSTLDTAQRQCITIEIEVEDFDSASVMLIEEEPRIPGATLTEATGLTATWEWCPSAEQLATGEERFRLVLSANDLTNPKTVKNYLIVLREDPKPGCEGEPPVITHVPQDVNSLVGLNISADISDDRGLKLEPLLYYSLEAVGPDPDLARMTQVSMRLDSGDMVRGTWSTEIPNPVAAGNAGDAADIHYIIVANDDDDQAGDCDHITQEPATAAFQMRVTNPGGAGGAGICEACTTDRQCGDDNDLCVRVGVAAESFCLQNCASDAECPTDFICSPTPVESIEGISARQCIPNSNDCADPGGTICRDDDLEDNDSQQQAAGNPAIAPGSHDLVSCPHSSGTGGDDDWFQIVLTGDTQLAVNLTGGTATDLDLSLHDDSGALIAESTAQGSTESVGDCLLAGTYFVQVKANGSAENAYSLSYTATADSCVAICPADDAQENDDSISQARTTDIDPAAFISTGNAICVADDDWFRIGLFDGETIFIDLDFIHADGDIDVYLYDQFGFRLTPCCSDNGQSITDDEHLEYTVPSFFGCDNFFCPFFVRVQGYNGAENSYDIRIGLTPEP